MDSIVGIIVVLGAMGIGIFFWIKKGQKGNTGKQIKGKLQTFCKLKGLKLYENISLKEEHIEVEIPYLMVGTYGMTAIFLNKLQGEIYGVVNEEKWTNIQFDQKLVFPNPIMEVEEKINKTKKILSKNNINSGKLEYYLVFDKEADVNIPRQEKLLKSNELMKALDKVKYISEGNYPMEKTVEFLNSRITKENK